MISDFRKMACEDIKDNPFSAIGKEWMLITAGPSDNYNTMTAAWGGLGVLWHKNVCFTFVRPTRHTYGFTEKYDNFTLSFFEEKHRNILQYCGTHSGRDVDKARETGLTPVSCELPETTAFEEARLVIECKKLYFDDLKPASFLDPEIEDSYPDKDYHRMYVGEIAGVYTR